MNKMIIALAGVLVGVTITLLVFFANAKETAPSAGDLNEHAFADTPEVEGLDELPSDEAYLADAPPYTDPHEVNLILSATACGDLYNEAIRVDVWRSGRVAVNDPPKIAVADYYLALIDQKIADLGYC